MKVLVNFNNGSIYCANCVKKLKLQETKDQSFVETWNKLGFQHMYCRRCQIEVYEGNLVNGQHLAMFI